MCFISGVVVADGEADRNGGLPTIELGVGLGGQHLNDYRGSKEAQTTVLPLPFGVYRGNLFKADRGGVRTDLFATPRFELNLSAAVALSSGDDDNSLRRDMPELGSMFEFGPSFNINLTGDDFRQGWMFRIPLRAAFSLGGDGDGYEGYIFNPKLTYRHPDFYKGWSTRVNIAGLYGSESFHDYYYTVDTPFVTADRPYYKAKAGYSGAYGKVSFTRYRDKWYYGISFRYDYLNGAVFEDSPLVETNGYYAISFGISRVLWQSKN